MSLKRKRNPYDAQLKVIKFAKENNNSATDRHFAVNGKLVRMEKAEEIFIWNAEDEKGKTLWS